MSKATILKKNDLVMVIAGDAKGKKARVFGKWLGEWVSVLGGAPTLISGSEQFLAYQRGTVDIGMTGVSGVVSRKLWEVMDAISVVNNADIEFLVVINGDVWEGLTEDQRTVLTTAARNAETAVRDYMSELEADAFKQAEANGMKVYYPTDDEIAKWKEASAPVIEAWLAETGNLGRQLLEAAQNF